MGGGGRLVPVLGAPAEASSAEELSDLSPLSAGLLPLDVAFTFRSTPAAQQHSTATTTTTMLADPPSSAAAAPESVVSLLRATVCCTRKQPRADSNTWTASRRATTQGCAGAQGRHRKRYVHLTEAAEGVLRQEPVCTPTQRLGRPAQAD